MDKECSQFKEADYTWEEFFNKSMKVQVAQVLAPGICRLNTQWCSNY